MTPVDQQLDLNNIKAIYFIGAGGIGMSALARYFIRQGLVVAGYDKTQTALTAQLEKEGMLLHYQDDTSQIPHICKQTESTLIVYTPAVPQDHQELQFFRNNNFRILKRAQVLGILTRKHKALCAAGTHGKTSTTAICAHILSQSEIKCNAFLGGIAKNYGTNYIVDRETPYVVIEADEYDRSFHQLTPYITVITSTDPDHLDIYKDKESYLQSFEHYTSLIQPGGTLIRHRSLEMKPQTAPGVKIYDYDLEEGDFHAKNIQVKDGKITFDLVSPIQDINHITLGQPIYINIQNSIAAIAMAQLVGCTAQEIKYAISTYKGVDRRFDFHINTPKVTLISDYAHHPDEIKESIRSIKKIFPDKPLTVFFQPHLYSRTNDFYPQFAEALSQADHIYICPIYPAREKPIPGVTSKLIFDHITGTAQKQLISKEQINDIIKNQEPPVILILGAGDIEEQIKSIKKNIKTRYKL